MATISRAVAGATLVGVVFCGAASSALAADQGITGKKLILKSTPKFVLLSKDASISIAGSDPVGGSDSSLTFDDGSGPVTLALPKSLWSQNGSGTLFKYKNATAPSGPSVVKIAKVKAGLLKVVGKGLPFAVPAGTASISVVLTLDGGTNQYCMNFAGTGDGSKLLVKDAPAGSCAPPPPVCTGELVGGFCWYLGAAGGDCDTTCTNVSRVYDSATASYAGSGGTDANCQAVLAALGIVPSTYMDSAATGIGCNTLGGTFAGRDTNPTTSTATALAISRVCACQ
jgi:hypothetical protein